MVAAGNYHPTHSRMQHICKEERGRDRIEIGCSSKSIIINEEAW